MPDGESVATPRMRQAAIVTIAGAVMAWGVPFAEFRILPNLVVADSAAQTARNLTAHHGAFLVAIFAYYLNFIGDIVAAWGLYLLLRPVNASISMFAAWVRVAFAALGLAAVLNLVTANRLVTRASDLAALGQAQLDAQVFVAIGAFRSQFSFSLILFGVHLVLLGWLFWRSTHLPRWLGVILAVDGLGWILLISGRYVGVNLEFLFVTSFGELVLLVWLIGWGTRLRDEPRA
jgi:hypothetical protein